MPALRPADETERPSLSQAAGEDEADEHSPDRQPQGLRRAMYLTLASIFFGVAALGAILPGLPCTPFLLLTSYFLLRSSPKLNERLLRSRLFGPVLRDWQERGGVARRVKVKAILLVLLVVGVTLYFADWPPLVSWIVGLLALVGVVVIARLPLARRD